MSPMSRPLQMKVGGGTDRVLQDGGDAVTKKIGGGYMHTVAHCGNAHVQAPADEGGGNVRALDACHDIVPVDGHEE